MFVYVGSEVRRQGDTRVDTHATDKMPPIRQHAKYREPEFAVYSDTSRWNESKIELLKIAISFFFPQNAINFLIDYKMVFFFSIK